jgi:hypothetical protein
MLPSHKKAMVAIETCRTAALGGHVYYCKECREDRYSYHSCKSRYCPQCGNEQADDWLAKQEQLLLKAPYFLVTFTLPAELRPLARGRQRSIYNILMRASARTVLKVMGNRKYLGGMVGMLSVLQTWTRDLRYHPHVHILVAGGALSKDRQKWLSVAGPYLAPQKVLSSIVAGKFYALLKKEGLSSSIPSRVWKQPWVADVLPVGGGQTALRYLAPYIFRIAISNRRLVKLQNGKVTFEFKDSKSKETKFATLPVNQFIHRFLQHVLPHRFIKARTYGLFSPRRRDLLERAKQLAGVPALKKSQKLESCNDQSRVIRCPLCKTPMEHVKELPRIKNYFLIRAP